MNAADIAERLLHRDGNMLILDKPAGLAVHPGPRTPHSLEVYLPELTFGLPRPPALAHRLDRDTAGCLVLGRHPKALRKLNKLFSEGLVEKTYWAVVAGSPAEDEGAIDAALLKTNAVTGWKMTVDPAGQRALTNWRVLGRSDGLSWLELSPKTGRTHQIRIHCQSMGWPVLGDPIYGEATAPLHLLARAVSVPMQVSKPPVTAKAEPPVHMREALRACGWVDGA
jgi:tRNA pseudouridine32 synthase/23S rRNA pseudouridine746 synthase